MVSVYIHEWLVLIPSLWVNLLCNCSFSEYSISSSWITFSCGFSSCPYCTHRLSLGCLLQFLRQRKELVEKIEIILDMAAQICSAMKYLEESGFIHRDLVSHLVICYWMFFLFGGVRHYIHIHISTCMIVLPRWLSVTKCHTCDINVPSSLFVVNLLHTSGCSELLSGREKYCKSGWFWIGPVRSWWWVHSIRRH